MKTTLLAALAVAASVVAVSASAGEPRERLTAVAVHGAQATVYHGADLAPTRSFRADRAQLSSDGELIAYTRLVGGRAELRVASAVGSGGRLVARVRPFDIGLAFSPDGRQLALSSAAGIETTPVAAIRRRSVPLPRAWRGSRYTDLAYAPDGRRLVFSRTWGDGRRGTLRNELGQIDLVTGAATTLYRSENAYDMRSRPASFSPDGAFIAVDGMGGLAIVVSADGSSRTLTHRRPNGYDHSPLVSPDGRLIAFARSPLRGVSDVYLIRPDGTGLRRVTTTPIPSRGTPRVGTTPLAWSPDGTRLLVFRHDRFATVDIEARAITPLRTVGVRYSIAAARWLAAGAR